MINKTRETKLRDDFGVNFLGSLSHKPKLSFSSTKNIGGNGNDRFIPKTTSKKSYYSSSQLQNFLTSLEQLVRMRSSSSSKLLLLLLVLVLVLVLVRNPILQNRISVLF